MKAGKQGTASSGKHNRRNCNIDDRVSLQGSNKSGRKLVAIGGPLGRDAPNTVGKASIKSGKKKGLRQHNDQNVPLTCEKPVTRYYPDNIRFPANRQSLFSLQMNQVLRPAVRPKKAMNNALLRL